MFQIGGTIGAIIVGWVMDKARPAFVIGGLPVRRAVHPCNLAGGRAVSRGGPAGVFRRLLHERRANRFERLRSGLGTPRWRVATGVSWMLGMGRFGSILGSAVGGALLGLGWGFSAILGMLAVPAICAAVAIVVTQRGSAGAGDEGSCRTLEAAWIFRARYLFRRSENEVRPPTGPGR